MSALPISAMNTIPVDALETIATDIPGAEGIAVANDGRIFVGAEDGWIYVISPEGTVSQFAKTPGRPLGIAIDRAGDLFVCDWDTLGELYITNLLGNSVS